VIGSGKLSVKQIGVSAPVLNLNSNIGMVGGEVNVATPGSIFVSAGVQAVSGVWFRVLSGLLRVYGGVPVTNLNLVEQTGGLVFVDPNGVLGTTDLRVSGASSNLMSVGALNCVAFTFNGGVVNVRPGPMHVSGLASYSDGQFVGPQGQVFFDGTFTADISALKRFTDLDVFLQGSGTWVAASGDWSLTRTKFRVVNSGSLTIDCNCLMSSGVTSPMSVLSVEGSGSVTKTSSGTTKLQVNVSVDVGATASVNQGVLEMYNNSLILGKVVVSGSLYFVTASHELTGATINGGGLIRIVNSGVSVLLNSNVNMLDGARVEVNLGTMTVVGGSTWLWPGAILNIKSGFVVHSGGSLLSTVPVVLNEGGLHLTQSGTQVASTV